MLESVRTTKAFLVLSLLFALLAAARLLALVSGWSSRPSPGPPQRMQSIERLVVAKVVGAKGETLRLHFPEIPLNLDFPFNQGRLEAKVELKTTQRPHQVVCRVLKEGSVVAQSEVRFLTEQNPVDLGTVEVKRID